MDPVNNRSRGFQRALQEFGVPLQDEFLFRDASYEEGGAELARAYLALKERPTAVAIVNDYVALGFMVEVMRAGVRIPEDLSVAGHENQSVAAFCPVPLTTGTYPVDLVAEAVVDLLISRIAGDTQAMPPRTIVIKGEFVERASTAPPAPERV